MSKIPKRYSHFLYGVVQSGLTCAVSATIASFSFPPDEHLFKQWIMLFLISWITMLPVVIFAAPFISRITNSFTTSS